MQLRPIIQDGQKRLFLSVRHITAGLLFLLYAGSSFPWLTAVAAQASPDATPQSTIPAAPLYLPLIQAAGSPTAMPTQPPARDWDPRLDQRGTELQEADVAPGHGYWRLVRGVWYNEAESGGRHHILVDVIDAAGQRLIDVPIRFYWNAGETVLHSQAKPDEPYAVDFGMFDVAPSYGARPMDGSPADEVWGMGLGSIEQPAFTIHTSYGLVWQWTASMTNTTPTATPTPTATEVPPGGSTPTATTTPTPVPIPTATQPARTWDPRLDQRGAELKDADVAAGQGYWRLVRGVWYDEHESAGKHHIFVDVLDAAGKRLAGVPVRFYWGSGHVTVHTQEKSGEAYAADFGMNDIAPSYGAVPADGNPADEVWGMGLGSIEEPHHLIQTSYGMVWQWVEAPDQAGLASGTPTLSPTFTATPTATMVARFDRGP